MVLQLVIVVPSYAVNDEITISGADIGGADGTNDPTVKVSAVWQQQQERLTTKYID